MSPSKDEHIDPYLDREDLLRNQLLDKILIISSIVASICVLLALLRDLRIGWNYRDIIMPIAVGTLIILAVVRKRLSMRGKATYLIIAYLLGGGSGLFSLGMLAGSVFIFPLAAVLVSLFYSSRSILTFVIFLLLFFSFAAVGFCSGWIRLPLRPDLLMTSYLHWIVYVMCIVCFFVVSCLTICEYRRAMGLLVGQISRQRDELEKSGEDLLNALNQVKKLSGLLPICSSCKKIRDDRGYWNQLESYIENHSEAEFSHGICPECAKRLYPDLDVDD